jgi:hypothetical protein
MSAGAWEGMSKVDFILCFNISGVSLAAYSA